MCLALPGQILSISGDEPLSRQGRVAFGSVIREIALACTPEAQVGDYVLVHVGLALSVIDVEAAARLLDDLQRLEAAAIDAEAGRR